MGDKADKTFERAQTDDIDSVGDQSLDLDPEDALDPATTEPDRHPRIQVVGCGLFGFIGAAVVAGMVLKTQAQPRSPAWFVGLVLLLAPIFSYFLYWMFFIHPNQIDEKLKAEGAARGVNDVNDDDVD
jgi:hypothetical protein